MDRHEPMKFFSSSEAMQGLRKRLGGIFPSIARQRMLEMPAIETRRLVLRKFNPDDLAEVIAWEETPGALNREEEARLFLEYCFREYRERGIGPWAMQAKESREIVGNCGLPHVEFRKRCGEVNYFVSRKYRGQGFASEAVRALLNFGFGELGLTRIQARCETENASSERVMLRLGMKFERLLERDSSSKDPHPEQKLYAIQKKDFDLSTS